MTNTKRNKTNDQIPIAEDSSALANIDYMDVVRVMEEGTSNFGKIFEYALDKYGDERKAWRVLGCAVQISATKVVSTLPQEQRYQLMSETLGTFARVCV